MIKSFKIFESNLEIEKICNDLGIKNFQIVDGLVNANGDVDISDRELTKIPIKFGRVDGNFYCYNSKLTSLEGAPTSVGGNFGCNNNQLTSLGGGPRSVGMDFYCSKNQLISLEGAPQRVGGHFYCYSNKLTSLEGGPQIIGGHFYCNNNQLTTLEGAPKSVGGEFHCDNNKLISLEGSPHSVFGEFWCHNNQIRDFKVPEYSLNEEEQFVCRENPIFEIYKLFNTPKCIDLLNEYGAIGDGIVSRVKLEEVFLELGMEVPNLEKYFHDSKNWKLV